MDWNRRRGRGEEERFEGEGGWGWGRRTGKGVGVEVGDKWRMVGGQREMGGGGKGEETKGNGDER